MDKQADLQISTRDKAIRAWLKNLTETKGEKLPVMPNEVYKAIDNIKADEVIKAFKTAIPDFEGLINQNNVQALVQSWSYDGGEDSDIWIDDVVAYNNCKYDSIPGNTDLFTHPEHPGFEMDPKFTEELDDDIADELNRGYFCLDPVMGAWYTTLAPKFEELRENFEPKEYDPNGLNLDQVEYAYSELFRLKLVSLLRQTLLNYLGENPFTNSSGQPFHFFIMRHERWPLHILTL